MKKTLLYFSIVAFFALSYFVISCTHEAPVAPSNNSCIQLTHTETADTFTTNLGEGSITAVATGGTNIQYALDNGTAQSSGVFSGLFAGHTYALHVSNAEGCSLQISVTIDSIAGSINPCAGFALSASSVNPTSGSNGSITASASGGTGYMYSINSGTAQASGSFTGLAAGTYTVTATSAEGCSATKSCVLTTSGPCPTITVNGTSTNTSTACATDATITASATGGTAPYTYSKNGSTFQSSGTFSSIGVGSITITAKDANGCTGTTSVTVSGPGTVSFTNDVKPTINNYCGSSNISCHNHNNNWTTYSDIVGSSSGATWSSNLSTFLKRLRGTTGSTNSSCPLTTSSGNHNMPPSNSTAWTNFVKGALTNWVNQGYPNN